MPPRPSRPRIRNRPNCSGRSVGGVRGRAAGLDGEEARVEAIADAGPEARPVAGRLDRLGESEGGDLRLRGGWDGAKSGGKGHRWLGIREGLGGPGFRLARDRDGRAAVAATAVAADVLSRHAEGGTAVGVGATDPDVHRHSPVTLLM